LSETRRWEDRAAELVRQAQAGDRDAREALLAVCHPVVRRWAGVLTRDPDDADDVAQDALIQVALKLETFAQRARFPTWLYQVTRNAALSLHRRVARRIRLIGGMGARMEPDQGPDPSDAAETSQVRSLVTALFHELPTRQREVFFLVDIEGHDPVDAAGHLGLNPATVRAHLFRARHTLRARILERHPEIAEEFRA
jgi:RNA polymerase sigma-70 factor (ECF subfamily)